MMKCSHNWRCSINRYRSRIGGLLAPAHAVKVLEQVLEQEQGLNLLEVDAGSQPLTGVELPGEENLPAAGIGRYQLQLQLEGSYLATLRYLQALENLPWKFFWESVDYQVTSHPTHGSRWISTHSACRETNPDGADYKHCCMALGLMALANALEVGATPLTDPTRPYDTGRYETRQPQTAGSYVLNSTLVSPHAGWLSSTATTVTEGETVGNATVLRNTQTRVYYCSRQTDRSR